MMSAPASATRPSPRSHRLRRLRAVVLGLALALVAAQSLGAAHRAAHQPVETSTCVVCAVSSQPLALGQAAPPPLCAELVSFEPVDVVSAWVHASATGASPRAPPAIAVPTPS